jgi:tRNA C32,U32 (ribose-2'-O)-methylase TrmJ
LNIAHALAIPLYEYSKYAVGSSNQNLHLRMVSGAEIDLVLRYVGEIAKLSGFTKHKLPLLFASIRKFLVGADLPIENLSMLFRFLERLWF